MKGERCTQGTRTARRRRGTERRRGNVPVPAALRDSSSHVCSCQQQVVTCKQTIALYSLLPFPRPPLSRVPLQWGDPKRRRPLAHRSRSIMGGAVDGACRRRSGVQQHSQCHGCGTPLRPRHGRRYRPNATGLAYVMVPKAALATASAHGRATCNPE